MHRAVGLMVLCLFAGACSSTKTKRVDPADDDELMGTGIESADVIAIGDLANDLVGVRQLTGPDVEEIPTVAIDPVQNNTDVDFDAELLVEAIRQKLVQKASHRVIFVTRDELQQSLLERERQAKRAGEYTSTKQETKTGADYFLTGKAHSISSVGRGMESRAIFIFFQLIDAENGQIVWENKYQTKKVGKAGVIYR